MIINIINAGGLELVQLDNKWGRVYTSEKYELRTGHTVSSKSGREEQFKFLVCLKDFTRIERISEFPSVTWVGLEGVKCSVTLSDMLDARHVVGYGETEEEAWLMALE